MLVGDRRVGEKSELGGRGRVEILNPGAIHFQCDQDRKKGFFSFSFWWFSSETEQKLKSFLVCFL